MIYEPRNLSITELLEKCGYTREGANKGYIRSKRGGDKPKDREGCIIIRAHPKRQKSLAGDRRFHALIHTGVIDLHIDRPKHGTHTSSKFSHQVAGEIKRIAAVDASAADPAK